MSKKQKRSVRIKNRILKNECKMSCIVTCNLGLICILSNDIILYFTM